MSNTGYQVIARRWRPKQFSELVGQDHIVRTLKNAIEKNRIAHAYLFVGPRGTGKTSSARLFAKSLNCENGPSLTPEDDSQICQAIMAGSCMDVIEIDGASNNSVDQVRSLRDDCQYAPAQCRFKIYIIDEVHMLSNQAFNALLKTLEEPPPHVKFIFATTEAHKVLPTIVSRCQRFEFRPIPESVIAEKLKTISDAEGIQVDENALKSIARLANGGMRDAQSILDQMISFCGDNIAEQDVLEVYGLGSQAEIQSLAQAIASANYADLIRIVDQMADEGKDLYRVIADLQKFVREAMLDAIRNGGVSEQLGHPLTTESFMRILTSLQAGESGVMRGLSAKVNFEATLLRAIEESRSRAIDSLIKELTKTAAALPEEEDSKKKRADSSVVPKKKESIPSVSVAIPDEPKVEEPAPAPPSVEEVPDSVVEASIASVDIDVPEVAIPDTEPSGEVEVAEPPAFKKVAADPKQIKKWLDQVPDDLKKEVKERFNTEFTEVVEVEDTQIC